MRRRNRQAVVMVTASESPADAGLCARRDDDSVTALLIEYLPVTAPADCVLADFCIRHIHTDTLIEYLPVTAWTTPVMEVKALLGSDTTIWWTMEANQQSALYSFITLMAVRSDMKHGSLDSLLLLQCSA